MKNAILILLIFLSSNLATAQSHKLDKASSKMSIKGTSTVHDWESDVKEITCSTQFDGNSFKKVVFSAKVTSIKSGKSGMDKNTYVAMKSDKFPEITLKADELSVSGAKVKGKAALTIAGVTKNIDIELNLDKNGKTRVHGEIPLKMTDFNIEPPVAVFGTIKTGNDIKILIDIVLIKS